MGDGAVNVFLAGDVMTGRGVDQILPHPGDARLQELYARDALAYVALAEAANGPIPRPVDYAWPWGDALAVLDAAAPDVRVINLETSITRSTYFAPGKGVHYRMNPENIGCLTAGRPDVCSLANNHVLDFGLSGLLDTFDALEAAGLPAAGAGRDQDQAGQPAVVSLAGGGRVIVACYGTVSSGIPPEWSAGASYPGVALLRELSERTAAAVTGRLRAEKRAGDLAVVSIHWGPNWGYQVGSDEAAFAHALIEGGADLVHGHSSHHPRPIEVYQGKLVLYGCGDFIDDYEGISGYEQYRDDLRLLYFASLRPGTGELTGLRMVPMQARQMRLWHASTTDGKWLAGLLDRVSQPFGSRVEYLSDGALALRPG